MSKIKYLIYLCVRGGKNIGDAGMGIVRERRWNDIQVVMLCMIWGKVKNNVIWVSEG